MKYMEIDTKFLQKIVEENIPKMLSEALIDKYDSPLKKAIENAVKEKEGVINIMVNEILSKALTQDSFKEKLADAVISNLISKSLK